MPELELLSTVIRVPPLRARPADIPALEDFFLREQARHLGVAELTISRSALHRLQSYKYTYNISELQARAEL